jgi:oligopeptide/dipeptide ABC transporter ATP-binding protein
MTDHHPEQPLLSVRDLQVEFASRNGAVHAVNGVSFSLDESEAIAIVGESGSGKSATALSLLGLLPAEGYVKRGEIWFQGRDLLRLSEAELQSVRGADIGMVFQDPMTSLNPTLTIGRQVSEAIEAHTACNRGAARARAIELLELVGIPHAASRYRQLPDEFSGGMRQRVMIAMALSCEPSLLIADEPTTALDVTVQAQVLDLLIRLGRDLRMAVILITHDLAVAAQLANHVYVMYAGRIVEQGLADDIFAQAAHPYTSGLLASIPRLDRPRGRLVPIDGFPPNLMALSGGCQFAPRCHAAVPRCSVANPPLESLSGVESHRVACWVAHGYVDSEQLEPARLERG